MEVKKLIIKSNGKVIYETEDQKKIKNFQEGMKKLDEQKKKIEDKIKNRESNN